MKRLARGVGALAIICLVMAGLQFLAPQAMADTPGGLTPLSALPLQDGSNTGHLAPGEIRWYQWTSSGEAARSQEVYLTLFFTPDDGNRTHYVDFQIFPTAEVTRVYSGGEGQMQNLGAGGVVSRDGNPVTGELLWSGWMAQGEIYYILVSNSTQVPIDYWLFTRDVAAAELLPAAEVSPTPEQSAQVTSSPPPIPRPRREPASPVIAGSLLPLTSESGDDRPHPESQLAMALDGAPAHLQIPAIGMESGIVPVGLSPVVIDGILYARWNTPENLVGWHNLSARLNDTGNTVLNGHNDINAAVFRNLQQLHIGDEIAVYSGHQQFRYAVSRMFLVKEKGVSLQERLRNVKWISSTAGDQLTMVTCANSNSTHRLIVIALPLAEKQLRDHRFERLLLEDLESLG
jgi:LPXTG-site transpeptidase (sortase) family protein